VIGAAIKTLWRPAGGCRRRSASAVSGALTRPRPSERLRALGLKASAGAGEHGTRCEAGPYALINSYHCSRLNTNTGRLTPAMFESVFETARGLLEAAAAG
jgi:hypothetical protein